MISATIKEIIAQKAVKYQMDGDLIEAIIEQESSGDPLAVRMEFNFYNKYTKPMVFTDTEEVCRAMSWGLMQVMGQVARELGFRDKFLTGLLDPAINIEFGCKHFANKFRKYLTLENAISAYNAGSPKKINGKYLNEGYVRSVLDKLTKIKERR